MGVYLFSLVWFLLTVLTNAEGIDSSELEKQMQETIDGFKMQTMEIKQAHLCHACMAAIDFAYLFVMDQVKMGNKAISTSKESVMEEVCHGDDYLGSFKLELQFSCERIVSQVPQIFDDLTGDVAGFAWKALNHKQNFCTKTKACDVSDFKTARARRKSECESCRTVVKSAAYLLENFLEILTLEDVEIILDRTCQLIPVQYETFSDVMEICHQVLEFDESRTMVHNFLRHLI
jgi:hypothetical protein